MLTALIEFIHRLRDAAIPISMVEALDAAHALRHIDLGSRAELKAALAAVLVKRAEHRAPFAALFDISFAPRRAEASRPAGAPATLSPPLPADLTEAAVGEGGSEDLLAALLEALRRNDAGALRAIAALAAEPPIEDVDFLGASPTDLREMRNAIRPLARKLAARVAHRRRLRRHGRLDARRTIRRSLSAGGVPLEPAFRYPRVSKPDLYLLCDVSGSVAEFAQFTLSLLYAMSDEFPRIRSFAFVDGIDEVTALLEESAHRLDVRHLLARASVVRADGHSDYGSVFGTFWDVYGRGALGPRTTVLVTGDARNNYRRPGLDALRAIKERARRVYWLNPERRREWNTTDSIVAAYAPYCDGVFEVRNLRQLGDFVRGLA